MPEAIPFIALGLSAGATAVNAVQTADAQGEQEKQMAAQQQMEQTQLNQQQQQETAMTDEQQAAAKRDAELSDVKQRQAEGTSAIFDPGSQGYSIFGDSGFKVAQKPGSSLFGL